MLQLNGQSWEWYVAFDKWPSLVPVTSKPNTHAQQPSTPHSPLLLAGTTHRQPSRNKPLDLCLLHVRLNNYSDRFSFQSLRGITSWPWSCINPREYPLISESSLFEWRAPPWQLSQFVNSINAFKSGGCTIRPYKTTDLSLSVRLKITNLGLNMPLSLQWDRCTGVGLVSEGSPCRPLFRISFLFTFIGFKH